MTAERADNVAVLLRCCLDVRQAWRLTREFDSLAEHYTSVLHGDRDGGEAAAMGHLAHLIAHHNQEVEAIYAN